MSAKQGKPSNKVASKKGTARKGPLRPKTNRANTAKAGSMRSTRRQAKIKQEAQHSVWQTGRLAKQTGEGEPTEQSEHAQEGDAAAADAVEPLAGIRVQKLLADRGYGSRRQMEGWIKKGAVMVNGAVSKLGDRVTPEDVILVNDRPLQEKSLDKDTRVLMYHKPEGEVCTRSDPGKRPTVFKALPKIRGARWVSIGRLDINTTGLLLFTTNGALANKLMHPSMELEREYRCRIYGQISQDKLKQLIAGIEIEGHLMKFESIQLQHGENDKRNSWVHVVLKEGRNREVRRLWEAVDCQVSRLSRLRYGPVQLPRDLRPGKYRNLDGKEIARLSGDVRPARGRAKVRGRR